MGRKQANQAKIYAARQSQADRSTKGGRLDRTKAWHRGAGHWCHGVGNQEAGKIFPFSVLQTLVNLANCVMTSLAI